jgi:hypothetical protein
VRRSIGKFFGLAGMRAGFALGPDDLLRPLEDALGPWSVNGPARWVARNALGDRDWQAVMRSRLREEGERLGGVGTGVVPQKATKQHLRTFLNSFRHARNGTFLDKIAGGKALRKWHYWFFPERIGDLHEEYDKRIYSEIAPVLEGDGQMRMRTIKSVYSTKGLMTKAWGSANEMASNAQTAADKAHQAQWRMIQSLGEEGDVLFRKAVTERELGLFDDPRSAENRSEEEKAMLATHESGGVGVEGGDEEGEQTRAVDGAEEATQCVRRDVLVGVVEHRRSRGAQKLAGVRRIDALESEPLSRGDDRGLPVRDLGPLDGVESGVDASVSVAREDEQTPVIGSLGRRAEVRCEGGNVHIPESSRPPKEIAFGRPSRTAGRHNPVCRRATARRH